MNRILWILIAALLTPLLWSCAQTTKTRMEPELFFEGNALQMAQAIGRNDIAQMNELAHKLDLNQFHEDNMTFLIWAMSQKKETAFRELLKLGANPNLKDSENVQIVALAAGVSDDNTFLRILLENGGDPNSMQRTEPAILIAYMSDFWKNTLLLLSHKADINKADGEGNTVLSSAGTLNHFEEAAYLLQHGADPKPQGPASNFAYSVQESVVPSAGFQKWQADCKRLLLERGVQFPVPRPWEKKYQPLRDRWYQTAAGEQWQERLRQVAADPLGFGKVWTDVKAEETAALKAWMKAANLPEPR